MGYVLVCANIAIISVQTKFPSDRHRRVRHPCPAISLNENDYICIRKIEIDLSF